MIAIVTPEKIKLSSGTVVHLLGNWQDYQVLIEQRGDRPNPRIKYRSGEILLMSPLPKHGREASIIADIIKILLDYLGQNYQSFTPITMDLPEIGGIEPDYSFYITNWQVAVGKDRINWSTEPSPDLVLEIDVTNYTDINDYLPYRVPEVWLYKKNQLLIYNLEGDSYHIVYNSKYLPKINIHQIIQEYLEIASNSATSLATKMLRKRFPCAN